LKKKQLPRWVIGTAAAAGAVLLLDALYLERHFFEVKRFTIGDTGSGRKLRVVLLTDLHFDRVFWPYYGRLARKVQGLEPDLILITGDVLDHKGTRPRLVDRFLHMLPSGVPRVAIPGNHDYEAGQENFLALKELYKKHGVDFLINESKAVLVRDQRVMITGLDDLIEGCASFRQSVAEVGWEKNHLLLIHSPLHQETVLEELHHLNRDRSGEQQLNISYMFAGHNHGGQIRLLGYAPVLPKKGGDYLNGWYNEAPPYLYVSRGFGTSTVSFRFGARAEITVFEYYV
jgi:uncharacterized protein